MSTIEFLLRKMDVFYVPFTPYLNLKNKEIESSSIIGGLTTLIIYSFSFVYVILLKQWFYYEIPFRIATQTKLINDDFLEGYFMNHQFNESIQIDFAYNTDDDIEFFKKDEVIFIPLLYNRRFLLQNILKKKLYLSLLYSKSNQTINLLNLYDYETEAISLQIYPGLVNNEMYFFLVSCLENEMLLDTSQKCASQEIFEEKIALAGIEIDFVITTKSLDIQTKNISESLSYTLSFIQNGFSSIKFLSLQYTNYKILEGFFQETQTEYVLKTDFSVRNQMGNVSVIYINTTLDYVTQYSQYYNPNLSQVYAGLYIHSSNAFNEVLISYPTISEQLASIGSITQALLFIGIIIRIKNRRQMILQFKKDFRYKFFPELECIQRRRIGNSYQYYYQGKKINSKSYTDFIKQTETKIDEKLNFFNLIYEVSRIQIVLEEIATQYKILQSHFKNFELDFVYCRSDKEYHIINYWSSKSETQNLKKRQSLAPFSLNYSTLEQSGQICKTLISEPNQNSHITICADPKYSSGRFCESKSIH